MINLGVCAEQPQQLCAKDISIRLNIITAALISYLIGQNFDGQNCRNFGVSDENFVRRKFLSVENFVRRNVLSVEFLSNTVSSMTFVLTVLFH